jgi:hypothetical protein
MPNHTAWVLRSSEVFCKAISHAKEIDPAQGENILKSLKEWRLSARRIEERFADYEDLNDYLGDRVLDLAWG